MAHQRTRSLFLRSVGAVFAIAFASLAVQIDGLLGSTGLEPAGRYLEAVRSAQGGSAPLRVPTVLWLSSSDAALLATCIAGLGSGVLLTFGLVPLAACSACWLLYLSLVGVGQDFLHYQWDALLLEVGFLAILWSPAALTLSSPRATAAPRAVLWCLRWLLFRLMFFSGWVKLASRDPSWWNLTALAAHYETQPLPAWTSWYAHQLPLALQRFSCALMFAIELALPFLIFGGRRARRVAFFGFVFLQAAIAVTGNYGFFNLLTCVLCIPLLADGAVEARRPDVPPLPSTLRRRGGQLRTGAALAVLAASLPLAATQLLGRPLGLPAAVGAFYSAIAPFQLIGRYGLFAAMTTTRPEIEIEGSTDGTGWQSYVFHWKPGPVGRAPGFVQPHMPRLDWQMWFDALYAERALAGGRIGRELITPRLLERLRDRSPSVLGLLAIDPFHGKAPTYLRWRLYQYRFTDPEERRRTGAWWRREPVYTSPRVGGLR